MLTKIELDISDAENILYGIQRLTSGLIATAYRQTAKGVLADGEAEDFIARYYDLTAGALVLTEAAANVLTHALVNGEICITAGSEPQSEA